jgi:hypothetical protein
MDESFVLIFLYVSPKLLFHVESSTTPNNVWTTQNVFFRNKYEMHGHMLENDLILINPINYENIQDLFTKFKASLQQLKGCIIDKSMQGYQLTLSTILKLGLEYSIFVYTFHTSNLTMGDKWKMNNLYAFIESLIREKDKLIKMGVHKNSKSHELDVHEGRKINNKNKQKSKGKKEPKQKNEETSNLEKCLPTPK